MAAAGQLLPSLATGIPPQALLPPPGIIPPLLGCGMLPGMSPFPNMLPSGLLPSNVVPYPPGLGVAAIPPPQLLAAAAAAAATLRTPPGVPQTSLPSSLLLQPQIEAYNVLPVNNPMDKRFKRKQSNRCDNKRLLLSLSVQFSFYSASGFPCIFDSNTNLTSLTPPPPPPPSCE